MLLRVRSLGGDDGVKAAWRQRAQLFPHGSDLKQCPEGCEEESRPSGHPVSGLRISRRPDRSHAPSNIHPFATPGGGQCSDVLCPPFQPSSSCPQDLRSRQMGQLLAWYRSVSAQEVQRHRWRQGRISVSRRSDRHTTHSLLLSLFSSSEGCGNKCLCVSGFIRA